ncbi:unnamed protein product [Rangifer tarandus platyrhynchus]|uniref:Uncharacterized protein n=2 Tax=Rangifer tarandus platyrhynchus TaxID=3082113 RepID=A0AC59ZZC0_RANTA|nr:unnamed protein product [Rangifer tarandus platyrhynchus]
MSNLTTLSSSGCCEIRPQTSPHMLPNNEMLIYITFVLFSFPACLHRLPFNTNFTVFFQAAGVPVQPALAWPSGIRISLTGSSTTEPDKKSLGEDSMYWCPEELKWRDLCELLSIASRPKMPNLASEKQKPL